VNNGNNTTTFTIDLTVNVGSSDGYSYGFSLLFSNSTGTAPQVLSSPAFTASLTKPGYDPLIGYTGTNIGTGTAVNYFASRYANRTDVLTYESDDSWFGFGSTDYTRTIVVTVQDCVEQITLDGDYRSMGTATAASGCTNVYNTGIACSLPCTSDAGTISISGGTATSTNNYDLTNCQTITLTASNADLNSGSLTYGWALFSCDPGLPLTTAQLSDLTTHPCYIGSDYGLSTNDTDAGGVSGTIPGGFSELWILPHTSDASNAIDADGDGCYDLGDVIHINYLPPTCGDCSNPTCAVGGVNEFVDRTYLSCDDPCADLNDMTYVTYHTVTTDAFGNVGVVQQLNFNQALCTGISRSAVLRDVSNSCTGPDINPSVNNANGVGSGFNPEWNGLSPSTNYTLILSTVIGTDCDYDYGCLDYYGIPGCTTINTSLDTTVCNGASVLINGTTYNASNPNGQESLISINGCDSIVTVTLTELPVITNSINPTICSNGSYVYNGTTYNSSNTTGVHVFTSASGCDSTVTLTLNIQSVITTTLDTTICFGSSIVVNGTTYDGVNSSGQETFVLGSGCDSIVNITVSELSVITNSINPTICSNGSYIYNGTTYNSSNTTGVHVFTSASGCDSTVTLTLNIQSVITTTLDTTICFGSSIVVNGTTYDGFNSSGQETFVLGSGCDSIVNITITELPELTSSLNPVICTNGSFIFNGNTYDTSNTSGVHILTSSSGCDSTVTIQLSIQNTLTSTIDTAVCYGETVTFNGVELSALNPTADISYVTAGGCDSIVTVTLTELIPDTTFIDTLLYVGQSLALEIQGDEVLIESDFEGLITYVGSNGCDSSILDITVLMIYEYAHFVPTGFSPNNDGNNDFIGVMGGGIEEMDFYIFNRWGEVVYETDCCCSQSCSWDGKFRGQLLNNGTYVYYLKGKYLNGIPFKEKGLISLIK
jgi:gliding motility-associated-like protein